MKYISVNLESMIRLPAYFTGFSSKSDGSASLRFSTQELTAQDFAILKDNHNAFGWLLFSTESEQEPPEEPPVEEGKTSGQVLRSRMFVYWKEKIDDGDFELWRRRQMDTLGQRYLDQLED